MKALIFSLFLVLILSPFAFADTQVSTQNIEDGDVLPSPYNCITYNGHNASTMQLTFTGCQGHSDGAAYYPVSMGKSQFEFNGACFYIKFVGYGGSQGQLWQPSKCTP